MVEADTVIFSSNNESLQVAPVGGKNTTVLP